MTVDELIADLVAKYPKHADQIEAWAPQYRQLLQNAQGSRLAEGYMVLMTGRRALFFPRPEEVRDALPFKQEVKTEDIARQTTRERRERVEAASAWWKARNHDLDSFREYAHRCKHGIPTPEDMVAIEQMVAADRRDRAASAVDTSGSLRPVGKVKPNFVPRARRLADPVPAQLSDDTGQLEPATNQPAEGIAHDDTAAPETDTVAVEPIPFDADETNPMDGPPEPPPVASPDDYGAHQAVTSDHFGDQRPQGGAGT